MPGLSCAHFEGIGSGIVNNRVNGTCRARPGWKPRDLSCAQYPVIRGPWLQPFTPLRAHEQFCLL